MFKRILPTVIAMLLGMVVLLGYLLPIDVLVLLRIILLRWATVLGAFALLVAYLSVLRVHLTRLFRARKNQSRLFLTKKNQSTSLLVVVSALGSLGLVVWQGVEGQWTQQLLNMVLVPGESALLALTAVTLIVAGMRIFRMRRNAGGIVFIVTAVFVLLTTVAYNIYPDFLVSVRQFVDTIATAGMRGILMGVALGVTLTGLRIILGIDRPHSDEG